jgi:hydrogenase assembly chaperone HypC/HupF
MCISVPGQIIAVHDAARQLALVDVQGERRVVNCTSLAADAAALEACVGTWVLMRESFALAQISEDEARRSLEVLALMQGL